MRFLAHTETIKMCIKQFSTVAFAVFLLIGVSTATAADVVDSPLPDALASFKPTGRFVRIPIKIRETSIYFLMDTGSSFTVLDSKLSSLLGPIVEHEIVDAGQRKFQIAMHHRPELHIGSETLLQMKIPPDGRIGSTDLSILREGIDNELYGILGMDLMRDWVVCVSFDDKLIGIWRDQPRPPAMNGQQIPIDFRQSGVPQIRASVSGREPQPFVVDTGMMGSACLTEDQYQEQIRSGEFRQTNTYSAVTLAGERLSGMGRPLRLELQHFKHNDLVVSSSNRSALGLAYWRRYRIVFDFPARTMLLSTSSSYAYPDVSDCDGLRLEPIEGSYVIRTEAGSVGYHAGIRDGDIIARMNGVPGNEGKQFGHALGMNYIGNIQMTLLRDGKAIDILLPRPWSELKQPQK